MKPKPYINVWVEYVPNGRTHVRLKKVNVEFAPIGNCVTTDRAITKAIRAALDERELEQLRLA